MENKEVMHLKDEELEEVAAGEQITVKKTGYTCQYCGQKHSLNTIGNPPCEEGRKALGISL